MRRSISTSTRVQLLEEKYLPCPWKVLISCILLNRTSKVEVEPVIERLFEAFPTPEQMAVADQETVAGIIRTLGFQNRRAQTLRILSQQVVEQGISKENVMKLRGVGKYARDAYMIFFHGSTDVPSEDYALQLYVQWRLDGSAP